MSNEKSSRKYFISFVSGVGLGIVVTAWYYNKTISIDKEEIVIRITDQEGKSVIKEYHYDKNLRTINFKNTVEDVNVKIILDGKERDISKFTGNEIKLQNNH